MDILIKKTSEHLITSEEQLIYFVTDCFNSSVKHWSSHISMWKKVSLDFVSDDCEKWKVSCYLEFPKNTYLRKERTLQEILDIVKNEKIVFK